MLAGIAPTKLPSIKDMTAETEKDLQRTEKRKVAFPGFVNYVRYMDVLATDIGCKPVRVFVCVCVHARWQSHLEPQALHDLAVRS